jgi:hypothetical protein
LITSNELGLKELIPYIESYLIENKGNWMEQNFDLICRTSFENNNTFLQLQKYCKKLIIKNPEKIFKSLNSFSIPEDLLLSILKNDDNNNIFINIKMNEVQIWDHVLNWGIAKNSKLSSIKSSNYSNDDFIILKNTLKNLIPFIKFTKFTTKEFLDKVYPYRKIIPEDLYENLILHFLNSNNNLNTNVNSISHTTNGTEKNQVGLETIEETKNTQLIIETRQIHSESQIIKETQSEVLMTKGTNQIQLKPQMTKENQSKSLMAKETNQIQPELQTIKETKANQSRPLMVKETNQIQPELHMTKENQSKPLMAEENYQIQPVLQMTKEIKENQAKSQIITNQQAELIVKWIDEIDAVKNSTHTYSLVSKFIFTRKPNYNLKLLFRGSRDGFMPKEFHNICDNQPSTITVIKVKNSNEILGGYNPIEWKSNFGFGNTKGSFIFSFANRENINDHIISRVKDEKKAINFGSRYGPSFGYGDLILHGGHGKYDDFYINNSNYCKVSSYEKPIRKIDGTFSIEDYEIFQVTKKN